MQVTTKIVNRVLLTLTMTTTTRPRIGTLGLSDTGLLRLVIVAEELHIAAWKLQSGVFKKFRRAGLHNNLCLGAAKDSLCDGGMVLYNFLH
jgi:hypothetical protein